MLLRKSYLLMILLTVGFGFSSCGDDDDGGGDPVLDPTGSVVVDDQESTDGTITLSNVVMSDDGWIVITRDADGAPGSEIIATEAVDAGTHADLTVNLDDGVTLENGETLWVTLYSDDDDGMFEDGVDEVIMDGNTEVSESFVVTVPGGPTGSITVEDQAVVDNTLTLSSVTLDSPGWIVVHADDGAGAPVAPEDISDPFYLEAGTHENVTINLDEDAVAAGDTVWVMLHTDDGVEGEYEFDGESGVDDPISDETGGTVMTSITITE